MVSLFDPRGPFLFQLLNSHNTKQSFFDTEPGASGAIPRIPERPLLPSFETISQLRKAAFTFTSGRAKP